MTAALALIVIAVIALVVFLAKRSSAAFQPNAATAGHLETIRNLYRKHGLLQVYTDTYSSVILRDGEFALFISTPVTFSEEKSHTNFGGASIRVAKGVRIGGGQSRSIPTIAPIDKGELLLTNRRVIFTGAMRTMEVRLSQLDALEFNATTLLLRKSGRQKAMYFNVSTGYAMAIGEIIQAYLAHDDWRPTTNHEGVPMIVAAQSAKAQQRGSERQRLEAELDSIRTDLASIYRAYAPFLVLAMNADGVVTDAELDAVREMDAEGDLLGEGSCEWLDAVTAVLDGRGMDLADALAEVLKMKPEARAALMKFCERIAGAEGRSEAEEEVLAAIRTALFPEPEPTPAA